MKAMGANTVRIYGWDPKKDHTAFLDAVHAHNLSLMTTFYMGDASENPVSTQAQRDSIIKRFAEQVGQYKHHPALMLWSFGNELNGVWNGYLQALDRDPDQVTCGWDERYDDLGGCWIHKGQVHHVEPLVSCPTFGPRLTRACPVVASTAGAECEQPVFCDISLRV